MRVCIRSGQTTVKQQGYRPTCIAFAVTALHEYLCDVVIGAKPAAAIDLSEEFLFYHCKQRDGLAHCDGTVVSAAVASLGIEGQSREELCPYQSPGAALCAPTSAALADGQGRLLRGLVSMRVEFASVERCLCAGKPVIAVLDWYANSYLAPRGFIDVPAPTDRWLGRHAVVLVELEDELQCGRYTLGFKNSWGPKWGDAGFGRLSEAYFVRYCRELWGSP